MKAVDGVSTISLISSSRNRAQKIPKIIAELPQEYYVSVGAHWTNPAWAVTLISHRDASKGAGLRYVQHALHITPEETIAIGDGASDVSMMQHASVRVAMGNAEPELKRVATHTAPSVTQDGVAEIINRFILPMI